MTTQLVLDLPAPSRNVPQRASASWCCTYCRRGYVPATNHHPDAATCPACGGHLEENRP